MIDEQVEQQILTDDDIMDTGSVPVPPASPDAHEAVITGVTKRVFDSGATAIEFGLTSTNVPGLDTYVRKFLPKAFVEDILCPKTDLSEGELFQYRETVSNDDHSAFLQTLVFNKEGEKLNDRGKREARWEDSIARKAGRTSAGLGLTKPTNIDEYIDNLSKLTVGLPVIMVRRPGKGEYKSRLEVTRLYSPEVKETPGKKFNGIDRLAWEQ